MSRIEGPQNRRSRRTRAALLDAAWELIEERGAEHATITAVADRAGVSRRAVYLHFSSRAELLLALHAHVDEQLDLGASVRPVLEAPDAVTALEEFIAHLVRYHPRIMNIDLALLRARHDDPDVAELLGQGKQQWHEGCRAIAQRLADEGRLAEPWTVVEAADLLWNLMFPDGLERLTIERGWPLDRYRELLTALVGRTLVTPDDRPL
jgi:AcrR family transcriptional regulator